MGSLEQIQLCNKQEYWLPVHAAAATRMRRGMRKTTFVFFVVHHLGNRFPSVKVPSRNLDPSGLSVGKMHRLAWEKCLVFWPEEGKGVLVTSMYSWTLQQLLKKQQNKKPKQAKKTLQNSTRIVTAGGCNGMLFFSLQACISFCFNTSCLPSEKHTWYETASGIYIHAKLWRGCYSPWCYACNAGSSGLCWINYAPRGGQHIPAVFRFGSDWVYSYFLPGNSYASQNYQVK